MSLTAVAVTGVGVAVGGCVLSSLLTRRLMGKPREAFPLESWVALYDEEAFEPDVHIVDAHHHLWDPIAHDKGWPINKRFLQMLYAFKPPILHKFFASTLPREVLNSFGANFPIDIPYMANELLSDIAGPNGKGHTVLGTVYVESHWNEPGADEPYKPVKEADMAAAVHRQHPYIVQAIVPHADLTLGREVAKTLEYYKKNPLVKGIRHGLAWDADESVHNCLNATKDIVFDKTFREGFAELSKFGFSYDTWIFGDQVDGLTDLAKAFPNTTIVCDHLGFPLGLGSHSLQESTVRWKQSMKLLAECPNVVVKIGGMGMRFWGFGFDERNKPASSDELAEAWAPHILFVIESFGVERCLMESNFPMDKITCSYTVLFNALKKVVRSFSSNDKAKLFSLNAMRVYRF